MHGKAHTEWGDLRHLVVSSVQTNKMLDAPLWVCCFECVHVCTQMHMCVHACGDQWTISGAIYSVFL